MIKELRKYINTETAEWMAKHHPAYPKVKLPQLGKTSFAGCNVFCREVDDQRKAWVILGAGPDGINAEINWTSVGEDWDNIVGWDSRTDKLPPASGRVSLTDDLLVGDDIAGDGARYLDVADPPQTLQEQTLSAWKKTDIYRRSHQLATQQILKKNPQATEADICAEEERGLRLSCGTWPRIAKMIELDEPILQAACGPVLDKIFYLLEKYGFPFLDDRLK